MEHMNKKINSSAVDVVVFQSNDPENPKYWSRAKKRMIMLTICLLLFAAYTQLFSLLRKKLDNFFFRIKGYWIQPLGQIFKIFWKDAPAQFQIIEKYGVDSTVSSLGLSLYILGFAFGPLICPLSEMYGRRIFFLFGWPLLIACAAPSAWADDIAVIILFRFFAGFFSGIPLGLYVTYLSTEDDDRLIFRRGQAVTVDLLSSMFSEVDLQAQGVAASLFTFSAFSAPVVGPVIGFFIADRVPNELWCLRVFFFMLIGFAPLLFFLPETHLPTILAKRAKNLRKAGNPRAYAQHELSTKSPGKLLRIALVRPLHMLVTEPIVAGASFWMSLSYGILYFSLEAYPVIFIEQHHFPIQLGGLPFIPIVIGMLCAAVPYIPVTNFFIHLKLPRWMGDAGPETPEARLKLALFSCICLPVSILWLAWISGSETHWIAPTLAGALFGYANIIIFFTFITYINNCYTLYTASAAAATAFSRSLIGFAFPLFENKVLVGLGTKWGISTFGFAGIALLPVPIIYLRYGPRLRERSPYIQESSRVTAQMHHDGNEKQGSPTVQNEDNERYSESGDYRSTLVQNANEKRDSTDSTSSTVITLEQV
ncbi:hypothetical protein M422DRAFT_67658 [Sphaerobolus stellatus SS14]|uniref:Unplaced genomic scaffold SPHSTscaffold_44, whole genome shotgun sequence n=1 Tax=Sphaerobolus stellatus (strain SS14) TaxID=990650 RepID=A0A0C9ULT0_SPHS4|nr:hypothetical protein M422DRAFT_67658 [Sphaerobolus stellatus SS14]